MSLAPDGRPKGASNGRAVKVWQWYMLLCMLAGGVIGLTEGLGLTLPSIPVPVWIAGSAVLTVSAMAVTVLWMRDIDELAQRAHYVAWFWGGSSGVCALVFLVLAAPALQQVIDFAAVESWLTPTAGAGAGFVAGILASLGVLTLGYGAWWLVFWLRKR